MTQTQEIYVLDIGLSDGVAERVSAVLRRMYKAPEIYFVATPGDAIEVVFTGTEDEHIEVEREVNTEMRTVALALEIDHQIQQGWLEA